MRELIVQSVDDAIAFIAAVRAEAEDDAFVEYHNE